MSAGGSRVGNGESTGIPVCRADGRVRDSICVPRNARRQHRGGTVMKLIASAEFA